MVLKDYLTFDTLRDNREALMAFRDARTTWAWWRCSWDLHRDRGVFAARCGGGVVTGGFLFGLAAGTAFNVISATIGAAGIFLAARMGLGAALTAKIEAAEGRVQMLKQALRENEVEVLFAAAAGAGGAVFVANLLCPRWWG